MTSRARAAAAALGVSTAALAATPLSVIASTYVVHPGDTAPDIAVRHGISVHALLAENNIADAVVRVGQLLRIPEEKLRLPAYTSESPDIEQHRVSAGESVFSVARHFGVDPTALARLNGIGVNAQLDSGDVLEVPGRLARINALLEHVAAAENVPADLVKAVGWIESGWDQARISPTGAVGIMQLEAFTGEWVSENLAGTRLDIHLSIDNVRAGALLLRHLIGINGGSAEGALAAYYQGAASITEHGLFADTERYLDLVAGLLAA